MDNRNPDGKVRRCKECMRAEVNRANRKWRQGHRSHMQRLKREAYRRANPDAKTIAQVMEARAANAKRTEAPCKKCGIVKPLEGFGLSNKTKNGRSYQCLSCLGESERRRYASSPKKLEYTKSWAKLHPEGGRHRGQERRARQKGIPGSHTLAQWLELCARFQNRCVCCGKTAPLTRDHIIPITNPKSSHNISNIQPLCYSCNSAKGNRRTTDYRGSPFTGKGEPRKC